jgi:DNA-binding MarR family transcriptional regulator
VSDRELEREVLRVLGDRGPLSRNEIASQVRCQRQRVFAAVQRLERRGMISRSVSTGLGFQRRSVALLEISQAPAGPKRKRVNRYVPDRALEDIRDGKIDPREWAVAELKRREVAS